MVHVHYGYRTMSSEHLHVSVDTLIMVVSAQGGEAHLARPECAQMSEKSTPRRSSEAKAVISAHGQDLFRSRIQNLSAGARVSARQYAENALQHCLVLQ